MRTHSSSNLPVVSPNPSTSNPKRRNRRHSKQPFILEESPVDTMVDQRTMAELLRAPTEGYTEAIVVPPILAEQFKLKHSLINMMTSDQFFGLEKDNPHDHIRWDNIQGYVSATTVNYNQGNSVYRPLGPTSSVQKYKPPSQRYYVVHKRDPLHSNIPYPSRMLKQKQQEKDEVQIHKFWQMFKQLHINITLADALILLPKYQKILKALLSNKEKLQELSPLILGRPFLWTDRALIDVHGEEMILRDGDERLTLNMRHDTSSYSNQPQKESINLINVFNNSKVKYDIFEPEGGNVLPEKLLDLDSTKDLHPPLHVSGSTTYSSSPNKLLKEFVDELALITFPPKYDDDLQFDNESELKEIEFLLHQDIDSSLKDSIDLSNLADNFVDSMPEMFTKEHALDYSSPTLFDEYDDDLFKVESDTENVYDDPFESMGEKIKESKLLINELDLLCDFLPSEYDSIFSEDFSRVDALPSTNNEDKVFNPGILIHENPFETINRVVQDKKLATSNTS
nr:reverse transcriptase domain-containing protein [Tanacetum cinerariifolium]